MTQKIVYHLKIKKIEIINLFLSFFRFICKYYCLKSLQSLDFKMPWTTELNLFIVEAYFRQKSIRKAQLQFKKQFKCVEFPSHTIIYIWDNKFKTDGTVNNIKTPSGNHTVGDRNHQRHRTTLLRSEILFLAAQASLCVGEVSCLKSEESSCKNVDLTSQS